MKKELRLEDLITGIVVFILTNFYVWWENGKIISLKAFVLWVVIFGTCLLIRHYSKFDQKKDN